MQKINISLKYWLTTEATTELVLLGGRIDGCMYVLDGWMDGDELNITNCLQVPNSLNISKNGIPA